MSARSWDEVPIGEVERVIRVTVYADVAQVCKSFAADRAKYAGTDYEFVADFVKQEAYDFLDSPGTGDDGFRVEEEWDEVETTFYGDPSAKAAKS